jgi:hypothetical protein
VRYHGTRVARMPAGQYLSTGRTLTSVCSVVLGSVRALSTTDATSSGCINRSRAYSLSLLRMDLGRPGRRRSAGIDAQYPDAVRIDLFTQAVRDRLERMLRRGELTDVRSCGYPTVELVRTILICATREARPESADTARGRWRPTADPGRGPMPFRNRQANRSGAVTEYVHTALTRQESLHRLATGSSSRRSAGVSANRPAPIHAVCFASSSALRRATAHTVAPADARATAIALPMPLLAPGDNASVAVELGSAHPDRPRLQVDFATTSHGFGAAQRQLSRVDQTPPTALRPAGRLGSAGPNGARCRAGWSAHRSG